MGGAHCFFSDRKCESCAARSKRGQGCTLIELIEASTLLTLETTQVMRYIVKGAEKTIPLVVRFAQVIDNVMPAMLRTWALSRHVKWKESNKLNR